MLELISLTKKLKSELSLLQEKFESTESQNIKRNREFFEYVKNDSELLFELIEKWSEQTTSLIENNNISVYQDQVNATKENFEMIILHSYYADIRKRRYVEMNKSCLYVFDRLIKEIEAR